MTEVSSPSQMIWMWDANTLPPALISKMTLSMLLAAIIPNKGYCLHLKHLILGRASGNSMVARVTNINSWSHRGSTHLPVNVVRNIFISLGVWPKTLQLAQAYSLTRLSATTHSYQFGLNYRLDYLKEFQITLHLVLAPSILCCLVECWRRMKHTFQESQRRRLNWTTKSLYWRQIKGRWHGRISSHFPSRRSSPTLFTITMVNSSALC